MSYSCAYSRARAAPRRPPAPTMTILFRLPSILETTFPSLHRWTRPGARASWRRPVRRRIPLLQRVDFDDRNARASANAADNRGVIFRRKRAHNRRFRDIRWRDRAVDDRLLVRAIHPVVIRFQQRSVAIA